LRLPLSLASSSSDSLPCRAVCKVEPFKHLTHVIRLTTSCFCTQGSPRVLLSDHFLSFSGYVSTKLVHCQHVFLQHFHIGRSHFRILLRCKQNEDTLDTSHASEDSRKLRLCRLGLHRSRCWQRAKAVFISICGASSILGHQFGRHIHPHQIFGTLSSTVPQTCHPNQRSSCTEGPHHAVPTSSLHQDSTALEQLYRYRFSNWPTTRLLQCRPWGIGLLNHPSTCSSRD